MSDSYISQTAIGISNAPEGSYGAFPVLANLYTSMLTKARILPVPDIRKSDSTGQVGGGSGSMYPYWEENEVLLPTPIEFQNTVDVNTFATLLRRFMGKTEVTGDITEIETDITFQHQFYEIDPDVSRQLPSTGVVYRNNGLDLVHGGYCGNTLNLSQQGSQDPQYAMAMLNQGLHKRIRDISPTFGTLPAVARANRMKGAETSLEFTDGGGTYSPTTNRRLRSVSFSANNNLDTEYETAGLPRIGAEACPNSGWYKDYLLYGDKSASGQMRLNLDDNVREWNNVKSNADITDWTWDMKGYCIPDTEDDNQFGLTVIVPYCGFRTPAGNEDNTKAVMDINIFPMVPASPDFFGVYTMLVTSAKDTVYA